MIGVNLCLYARIYTVRKPFMYVILLLLHTTPFLLDQTIVKLTSSLDTYLWSSLVLDLVSSCVICEVISSSNREEKLEQSCNHTVKQKVQNIDGFVCKSHLPQRMITVLVHTFHFIIIGWTIQVLDRTRLCSSVYLIQCDFMSTKKKKTKVKVFIQITTTPFYLNCTTTTTVTVAMTITAKMAATVQPTMARTVLLSGIGWVSVCVVVPSVSTVSACVEGGLLGSLGGGCVTVTPV